MDDQAFHIAIRLPSFITCVASAVVVFKVGAPKWAKCLLLTFTLITATTTALALLGIA